MRLHRSRWTPGPGFTSSWAVGRPCSRHTNDVPNPSTPRIRIPAARSASRPVNPWPTRLVTQRTIECRSRDRKSMTTLTPRSLVHTPRCHPRPAALGDVAAGSTRIAPSRPSTSATPTDARHRVGAVVVVPDGVGWVRNDVGRRHMPIRSRGSVRIPGPARSGPSSLGGPGETGAPDCDPRQCVKPEQQAGIPTRGAPDGATHGCGPVPDFDRLPLQAATRPETPDRLIAR